ncbi:hypothetical protein D3C72_1210610 [compost metagenome]
MRGLCAADMKIIFPAQFLVILVYCIAVIHQEGRVCIMQVLFIQGELSVEGVLAMQLFPVQ